jgi:membrane protease YdiL (CAAX protease family)
MHMRPVGRFSVLCNPVMAPLPAADELTDNLSSERTKRQRISMGNRPHRIWRHGCRRVTGKGATITALIGLTLVPLGQIHLAFGVVGSSLCLLAVITGARSQFHYAVRIATLALILAAIGATGLPFAIWVAVVVMWLASRRWGILRPAAGWLPAGRGKPAVWWLTAGIVVAAPIGLFIWFRSVDRMPEMTTDLMDVARDLPFSVLLLAGVIFVTVNSVIEEVAYRGIAFEGADSITTPRWAIASQAIAFGTFHVSGVPSGLAGVVLALAYGLVLGLIRHMSDGLRFPIVGHIAADAAILTLVLVMA